jgi:CBS domain-containing protein
VSDTVADPGQTGAAEPFALSEVTRFLRAHPPFDALPLSTVERVAASTEIEFFRAGATIFNQRAEPVQHLRVVRSGAVEVVHDGRVLDLLGTGELFGHASMLSGLPPGFEARAAEDTLCYRIDADIARELLSAPAGLRYVGRELLETRIDRGSQDLALQPLERDPANTPVGSLIRQPAVVVTPDTSIQDGARRMTGSGASCLIVQLGDGGLGIVTDRDLRRIVAEGLGGGVPITRAMSAPAYTCWPDRLAGEVLLEMFDRGLRHFPVVSPTGEVLGVIEDIDLLAARTRSSFFLRQRIAAAGSLDELAEAAAELRPTMLAMHDARVAAISASAVYSVVVDALTRRLLELAVADTGSDLGSFAWLALGSQSRREAVPSSDVDSAIVFFGEPEDRDALRTELHRLGQRVVAGLRRCGLRADEHGATASDRLFVRSVESWQNAARSWIADPTQDQALILVSVLVDSRPVWGLHTGSPVSDTFRIAPNSPALLRLLARFALSHRPPTGFLRGLVVEHSGEHRGRLDLKHGGLLPIVDLARWAGMAARVTSASTTERLRAAAEAGTLPSADAHTLLDAFGLISSLRLDHQMSQLREGREPHNFVDPETLSPLMRSHLREAFRAVASIQKRISAELSAGFTA